MSAIGLAVVMAITQGCGNSETSSNFTDTLDASAQDVGNDAPTDLLGSGGSGQHQNDASTVLLDGASHSETGDAGVCESLDFQINRRPVTILLDLDVSGSMFDGNWSSVKPSLLYLINKYASSDVWFGFDWFPDGSETGKLDERNCGVSYSMQVPCGPGTAAKIVDKLNTVTQTGGATPLGCSLCNFLDESYASGCFSPNRQTYLLLVSDGGESCGGCVYNGYDPKQLAKYAKVMSSPQDKDTKIVVVGFGSAVDEGQLDALASNGGMGAPFNHFLPASDQTQLQAAFDQIAGAIVSCFWDIQIHNDVDFDQVNFYFTDKNGTDHIVPFDANCAAGKGWRWANTDHTQVQFCSEACDELQSQVDKVHGDFGCPQERITPK